MFFKQYIFVIAFFLPLFVLANGEDLHEEEITQNTPFEWWLLLIVSLILMTILSFAVYKYIEKD